MSAASCPVMDSTESQFQFICLQLQELSRLKSVQEDVAALHDEFNLLRCELGKPSPEVHRKDAAWNELAWKSGESEGKPSDAMDKTVSMRFLKRARRRNSLVGHSPPLLVHTSSLEDLPSRAFDTPSKAANSGVGGLCRKRLWEVPQDVLGKDKLDDNKVKLDDTWMVDPDLRDDDRTEPNQSTPLVFSLGEDVEVESESPPKFFSELTTDRAMFETSSHEHGKDLIPSQPSTPSASVHEMDRLPPLGELDEAHAPEAEVIEMKPIAFERPSMDSHLMKKTTHSATRSTCVDSVIPLDSQKKIRCSVKCRLRQLHPDSIVRSLWDLLSCGALMFDSVLIPFVLAWNPDTDGFLLVAMLCTAIFWTIDIFATLNTGYFTREGDLETNPLKIFQRYLKRTLLLDTVICITDWLGIVAEYGARGGGGGNSDSNETWSLLRLVKINRIFRLASVLRVSRIWDRIERLNQSRLSNTWQILGQITAIFVFILWVNHILCCIWYAVGAHGSKDTGQSWLDSEVNSQNSMPIHESSELYQYTTAFHWSISQLTPGSMQVVPMNSSERIVNIFYLLFALLFVTSLISRMSALMVQLQISNRDQNEIVRLLRLFLRQKSVTASVAQRIEKQIVGRLQKVRPLTFNDIPALNSLSKTLRVELKYDLYYHHLLHQPVLRCLLTTLHSGDASLATASRELKNVCDSLECIQLTTNEELFAKGEVTRKSYLLVQGCLLYNTNDLQSPCSHSILLDNEGPIAEAMKVSTPSSWICSAALWLDWETRGYMEADSLCEVACLDGSKVLPIISAQHQRLASLVKHYQTTFASLLEDVPSVSTTDLEEVVDHALVVLYLPEANKIEICEPLLETLRQRSWFWGQAQEQGLKDLEREVRRGKSALIPSEDGSPVRVAIVATLRVYRPHGEMLIQVMDIKGSKFSYVCRLPGTKMVGFEPPSKSAKRLVDEVRDILQADGLDISTPLPHGTDVEKSASPTYGVLTQYNRTIFVAHQGMTSRPGPPRIQFDGHPQCITRHSNFLTHHMGIFPNHLDRSSAVPGLPGYSSSAETLSEEFIRGQLVMQMPWLESHFAEHVHIELKPSGKGSVYTWIYPDEFSMMQRMLNQTSD